MKYKLVFTNIHTHMDLVGEATDQTVIPIIQEYLKDGKLMLSELTTIEQENA